MPQELLIQAGLTPTQAEILGFLFSVDLLKAKDIVLALKKPRGVIYKGLEELLTLGLIAKEDEAGSVARFRAEHPSKLESLFATREQAAQKERQNFLQNLPALTSEYNLNHHKPLVNFFEGEVGASKALNDTLTSNTEILLFFDNQLVDSFFSDNLDYEKKRLKAGISKRVIIAGEKQPSTPPADNDFWKMTEIRYIGDALLPFKSSVKIYDNKLSYQITENNQIVNVLLQDKNIYDMNKSWFEFLWQIAK